MSNIIPFCFTSKKAKELYNGNPPQYETPFASGFDLRACSFNVNDLKDCEQHGGAHIYESIHGGVSGQLQEYCDIDQFQCLEINQEFQYTDFVNEKINGVKLYPRGRILIKTGIRVAMPVMENTIMELQIRSRSGLALKHGICVLNGIGTIDNDYRGELGVILYNAGHEPFTINIGDRIAQGVFNPLKQCIWQEVSEKDFEANFCNTKRGSGGFGSTGK